MSPARSPCSVLASAMLVAVALAAAPEALRFPFNNTEDFAFFS